MPRLFEVLNLICDLVHLGRVGGDVDGVREDILLHGGHVLLKLGHPPGQVGEGHGATFT